MSRARAIAALAALAWLLSAGLLPGRSQAQGAPDPAEAPPALLVADSIYITPDRQLIAEGNVEAIQGDTRLRASRITYDRASGGLSIEGPIRLDEGGTITVLADAAELDASMQNGLLTGARMVMNDQLQLAALQMSRVGGRYTQLYKTAVTSCRVCANGNGPPLWQIRARKVIHDRQERQLYFEGAQLRVLNMPVLYLPRLRLPDPTLKRATGFLIPSIRTTSQLGTGIKLPYFIRLGDSRDLTLTPYLSGRTTTLEMRYRQAFRRGQITFEGAFTRDDLIRGEDRGYLFGSGQFDLPRDFKLEFGIQATSDKGYLLDYGLPDLDRLQSEIALTRTRRDRAFRAGVIRYKTLRDNEDDSILPTLVADIQYQRRLFPTLIGGELRLGIEAHSHTRTSGIDVLGRDIDRASAEMSWRRNWILPRGLRADWQLGLAVDTFSITQDSNFPGDVTRTTPSSAFSLRYPMTRRGANGATQFLEPLVQLGWSQVNGGAVPNEESSFVEFDQGNLLALSRFPSVDRREEGRVAALGVNWARYAPSGWQAAATLGQVIRATANPAFTPTSGLSGTSSDILVAGQMKLDTGLALTARTLMDNTFSLSKAELRGDWSGGRTALNGSYLWLGADAAEGRARALSEVWLDGSYSLSPTWTASANLRYDISDARAVGAGVGLVYRNACVEVDLALNRRYTASTSVEPSTDFGFTIALRGFAVDGIPEKMRRPCM